jgi:hypothetical protein
MSILRYVAALGALLHTATLGVMAASAAGGAVPVPIVDPEVRTQVATGRSRVIVELRAEPRDDPGAIARVQRRVIDALPPGNALLAQRYTSVPMLVLDVDAEALSALESLGDAVVRVRADSVKTPQR